MGPVLLFASSLLVLAACGGRQTKALDTPVTAPTSSQHSGTPTQAPAPELTPLTPLDVSTGSDASSASGRGGSSSSVTSTATSTAVATATGSSAPTAPATTTELASSTASGTTPSTATSTSKGSSTRAGSVIAEDEMPADEAAKYRKGASPWTQKSDAVPAVNFPYTIENLNASGAP